MNARLYINAALLLLLAGLSLFILFDISKQPAAKSKLTPLNISDIHSIQIKQANKATVSLELTANNWQILTPIVAPASMTRVDRLLKISQIPNPSHYPLIDTEKANYGLDKPNLQLSFNQQTLSLGGIDPVNFRRYVAFNNTLSLLDDTFIHLLKSPLNMLIDTRLIENEVQIKRITSPQFDLTIDSTHRWSNSFKPNAQYSSDDIQSLLDEWRFARALSVSVNSENSAAGEDIILSLGNGDTIHFVLQRDENSASLQRSDSNLVYHFSLSKLAQLLRLPSPSEN